MKTSVIFKLLKNMTSKPMTVKFPYESIPIPDNYRGAQMWDSSACTSCSLCSRICPNRAIEMIEAPEAYRDKFPKKYPQIDLGKCCFCGLCQDICPTGALKLSKDFFLSTFDPSTTIKKPFTVTEQ